MNPTRMLCNAFLISVALAQLAGATTIVQRTGNSAGAVPLYFGGAPADTGAFAVEWTQTSSYINVTVAATLFEAGGAPVEYWLTDSLNSPTQNILASGSVAAPANPASVNLFQLPSLGPGDYFLILHSFNNNGGWLYSYPVSGAATSADTGVTLVNQYIASTNNKGFVPSDSFSARAYPVEFSVTATATPEPSTLGLLVIPFAALMLLRSMRESTELCRLCRWRYWHDFSN